MHVDGPVSLAPVDALRALPYPLAVRVLARLEAELGPEGVAALRYEYAFWARPSQRLPDPDDTWSTLVITGEYGTGKSWMAAHLFLREILAGRALLPRIIAATKPAVAGVVNGASGLLRWLPPHVPREWKPTKGYAGELMIAGVEVRCYSADSPGQMIGEGADLDFRDDVAKWATSAGEDGARAAWIAADKSCREGYARAIVPTTPDGGDFIAKLAAGDGRGVRTIDLGRLEENAGNLPANYLQRALDLRESGAWLNGANASPFGAVNLAALRTDECPPLVELAVAIDPARSANRESCEVGIVGGGKDAKSTIHVRHDRSAVLDGGKDGWPAAAWDLATELQEEHPGTPWHFVLESNTGTTGPSDLLRAEERARRLRRARVPLPGGGWAREDGSEVSVCEIRPVRAGKNKCERAKLPAMLAQHGQVKLASKLNPTEAGHVAEGQLKNLTPEGKGTDRADAIVHLIRDLAGLSDEREAVRAADEHEAEEEARSQVHLAAEMNARLSRRGAPPDPGPMKVEGAPPGDARYPGPPPFAVGRVPSWRTRSVF